VQGSTRTCWSNLNSKILGFNFTCWRVFYVFVILISFIFFLAHLYGDQVSSTSPKELER
jgi:hypothetical protein